MQHILLCVWVSNSARCGGATAPAVACYPMLLKAEDSQYVSLAADAAGGVGRDGALKTPGAGISHLWPSSPLSGMVSTALRQLTSLEWRIPDCTAAAPLPAARLPAAAARRSSAEQLLGVVHLGDAVLLPSLGNRGHRQVQPGQWIVVTGPLR